MEKFDLLCQKRLGRSVVRKWSVAEEELALVDILKPNLVQNVFVTVKKTRRHFSVSSQDSDVFKPVAFNNHTKNLIFLISCQKDSNCTGDVPNG